MESSQNPPLSKVARKAGASMAENRQECLAHSQNLGLERNKSTKVASTHEKPGRRAANAES
jgi:hypothetical protein